MLQRLFSSSVHHTHSSFPDSMTTNVHGFVTEKDGDKTLSGNKVTVWQIQQGQQGEQAAMSDEDTEALKPESSALAWQSLPSLPAIEV